MNYEKTNLKAKGFISPNWLLSNLLLMGIFGISVATQAQTATSTSRKSDLNILFVIDNSGSMGDEQSRLAIAAQNVLPALKDLTWNIDVVTTDCGKSLQKINNEMDSLDATNLLSNAFQAGAFGSTDERGIRSSLIYLFSQYNEHTLGKVISHEERCYLSRTVPHANKTAVVFISDENDFSNITTTEILAKILPELGKMPGQDIRFFGLLNLGLASKECSYTAQRSELQIDLIRATGGFYSNICREGYDLALSEIMGEILDFASSHEAR